MWKTFKTTASPRRECPRKCTPGSKHGIIGEVCKTATEQTIVLKQFPMDNWDQSEVFWSLVFLGLNFNLPMWVRVFKTLGKYEIYATVPFLSGGSEETSANRQQRFWINIFIWQTQYLMRRLKRNWPRSAPSLLLRWEKKNQNKTKEQKIKITNGYQKPVEYIFLSLLLRWETGLETRGFGIRRALQSSRRKQTCMKTAVDATNVPLLPSYTRLRYPHMHAYATMGPRTSSYITVH